MCYGSSVIVLFGFGECFVLVLWMSFWWFLDVLLALCERVLWALSMCFVGFLRMFFWWSVDVVLTLCHSTLLCGLPDRREQRDDLIPHPPVHMG